MKYKVLTLASAAAMLAACSDTSIADGNDQIKDSATVVMETFDARTKLPVEDVSVYYRIQDKTKKTDSSGTVIFKDVQIGDSYFDYFKEGYAFKRVKVTAKDNIQNDVSRVDDIHQKEDMYELGVNVQGYFFYNDAETGNYIPAKNVTIYAKYDGDDEIYPNEVYTTTDENGFYSFENLASSVKISLNSEAFVLESDSSKVFDAVSKFDEFTKFAGENYSAKVEKAKAPLSGNKPVLLSSNLNKLEAKDELKLVFSELLNKDSVKTNFVYVQNSNNTKVAVNVALGSDGKTVIVKAAAGSWVDGDNYTVFFKVWNKVTNDANVVADPDSRKFTVGKIAIPEQVKGLAIDRNDNEKKTEKVDYSYKGTYTYQDLVEGKNDLTYSENITIKWNAIAKNVDKYNVYVMGNGEKDLDYTFYQSVTDTTITINVATALGYSPAYPLNKTETSVLKVIVLPENKAGMAPAAKATALEIPIGEKVKGDVRSMLESKQVAEIKKGSLSIYVCENANTKPSDCAYKSTASTIDGQYIRVSFNMTAQLDADVNDNPAGYYVYYFNGEDWVKTGYCSGIGGTECYVGYTATNAPATVKISLSATRLYKFAVVPYFTKGTATISADDIEKHRTVTFNVSDYINNGFKW